jgi:phosphonate transport system substrate-binding protein
MGRTTRVFLVICIAALAIMVGQVQAAGNKIPAGWPNKVVIGFLPNEEGDADKKTALRLLAKDCAEVLGVPVEVVICEDYNAVIETMRNKKTHIAYFGPFSYILAHDRSAAEALVVSAKNGERKNAFYSSVFITRTNTGISKLNDIKGKKFAFVDPASTSGNLVPRAILVQAFNVKPDQVDGGLFSSVQFSGSHSNSLLAVANGAVDAAAVTRLTYETGVTKGTIKANEVKIIHESEPIPNSPIAVRGDLPSDFKERVRQFFVSWKNIEEWNRLRNIKGSLFISISDKDYDTIRAIAVRMNMKPEELLK